MEKFREHLPDMYGPLQKVIGVDDDHLSVELERFYGAVRSISIDNGLMEVATDIFVVKGGFPWDDLGSWSALERVIEEDASGNVAAGTGEVLLLDSSDSVVVSEDGIVAVLGVKDLIVVSSGGMTLVCPKDRAQEVKRVVKLIKDLGDSGKKFL
jgi:mannose-1-phosphate guanylyltransferase